MLVLLIIFMIASGVQNVQIQMDQRDIDERAEAKLEEVEALLAELEKKRDEHSKVPIDLPKVDSEPVKLSEVQKLKLLVNDQLVFSIDDITLVDCLQVSPAMRNFVGNQRVADDSEGEQRAFEPCLKLLGEKLVDNPKLQEDKELYVLAARGLHYGQVLRVMAAVRQSGVTKFGLVAESDILGGAAVEKTAPTLP